MSISMSKDGIRIDLWSSIFLICSMLGLGLALLSMMRWLLTIGRNKWLRRIGSLKSRGKTGYFYRRYHLSWANQSPVKIRSAKRQQIKVWTPQFARNNFKTYKYRMPNFSSGCNKKNQTMKPKNSGSAGKEIRTWSRTSQTILLWLVIAKKEDQAQLPWAIWL